MDRMMHVSVSYHNERLDFELPDERLVTAWTAPAGMDASEQLESVRNALEEPLDFPPLRQMIVSGDRVVIAFDNTIADPRPPLEALGRALGESGGETESVTVVVPRVGREDLHGALPAGWQLVTHDPKDRDQIAYLAATKEGRRVYLNRLLTDADVVVPIGRLGFDPIMGYRGPWSVIYPDLSDHATIEAHRGRLRVHEAESAPARARATLEESFEVSWLLGTQFHVGLVPGSSGLAAVVAGRENSVRERGITALNRIWKLDATSRAELVVVGIGCAGKSTTLDELAEGLATACQLVQRGGKIVALSRATGEIGPALRCLIDEDDPNKRAAALRGHEGDDDFLCARRFAQAQNWADVFVFSELPPDTVDDLSFVALERPEQARRLVAKSNSCSFVSQADLTRAVVRTDEEDR
jgi:nickel-dependent lactate racemase